MARGQYKQWQSSEGLAQLEGWARDGLTDEQIAGKIGIRRPTLYSWKKKYADINDALKKGKEVIDYQVEKSLLNRAMGMKTTDVTYKMVKIDEMVLKAKRAKYSNEYKLDHPEATNQEIAMATAENVPVYEEIPISKTIKELTPDTSAAIFWLKNRLPDKYREQSFKQLNEAQARKAVAEATIAEIKAEKLGEAGEDVESLLSNFMDKLDKSLDEAIDEQVDQDEKGAVKDEH